MKTLLPVERVKSSIRDILTDMGVKVYKIEASEPLKGDGYLFRVDTNLRSYRKAAILSSEVLRILREKEVIDEDSTVILYPKD